MQRNLFKFPPRKAIFIFLFFSFSSLPSPYESCKKAHQEMHEAQEKITKRFEAKLTQIDNVLEVCVVKVKAEPLYTELQEALQALYKDPAYKFYLVIRQTHTFIEELETYNKAIIRPALLAHIHELIDQLKHYEKLTSLRSTLKKQRVALLELFEEKDLILSVEKILKYQNKELIELITEQQKEIATHSTYQQVEQIHTKYLATSAVKKLLASLEKKREILLQQENALTKNKIYQKALHTYQLYSYLQPAAHTLESPTTEKQKDLFKLQHDLFATPLDTII